MSGVHWGDVVVLAAVWLVSAVLYLGGWWLLRRSQRRWEEHTEQALEVSRERHPSRWGAGPVPLEDREDFR